MDSNSTRRARRVHTSEVQKRRSFDPNNRALASSSLFASDDDSRGTHATCLTAKTKALAWHAFADRTSGLYW
ncbi:hypothetical protein HYQ45_012240 [Verticillium longisporum]|uniref:Uncharacterized protein n=1 Tax=Verticillium longisporum TaxID=100787 RepID=A0A8I3AMZ9_VERLO|nr:hypothetical protein HYQ45_012240 [Verticillium longisporum]